MAESRGKRLVALAKLSLNQDIDDDSDRDPYATDGSNSDPNFNPTDVECSSEYEDTVQDSHSAPSIPLVEDVAIPNIGSNLRESTSTSDSEQSVTTVNLPAEWQNPVGNHLNFQTDYKKMEGIPPNYAAALVGCTPFEYFSFFLDRDLIQMMVDQTNLYASQVICSADDIPASSRLHQWVPTSCTEMLNFLGLIGYMGLIKVYVEYDALE
ncbi:transposase is4 [Holotrichia oblita]|uniref:Transposase is4 n=1 Tax=Holotrichia oblita TaxID=644536 RepID=A0ACB9TSS6_HOLOL|nr:transposase is4 [Holotrichia oblita]